MGLLDLNVQYGDDYYQGTVILQNQYVTLWHHEEHNIIHHQMHSPPDSASFKALLNRGAELVEEFSIEKWLSDDRANTVLRDHDAEWADTIWLPRVTRAGFRFWSIVLPKAAIGQLNMRRFAGEYRRRGVIVSAVDNPYLAFDWLKSQDSEVSSGIGATANDTF